MTDLTFGRLRVVTYAGLSINNSQSRWNCLCACGNTLSNVSGAELRRGHIQSCGCLHRERVTTHGMTNSRTFRIWAEMKQRCTNPNRKDFARWGARGIAVCDRWLHSFENFHADMGTCPSDGHSIDRYPNQKGNYEPSNCRWATLKEQARNTRANHLITINNETRSLIEWEEISGVHRNVIRYRQNHGRTPEELISKTRTKWRRS